MSDETWRERANCANTSPDIFFPEGAQASKRVFDICAACPVRDACLAFALEHNETEGIWGGLSPAGRKRLRRAVA